MNQKRSHVNMTLLKPNVIIAGVTKAGTTSLFTYLNDHPAVLGSSIKEINHFLPIRFGNTPPSIDNYDVYFRDSYEFQPLLLEASPAYFYGGRPLADEIRKILQPEKIFVLLRDPRERLVSFFNFQKSMLNLPKEMRLSQYIDRCMEIDEEQFKIEKNYIYFGLHSGIYSNYLEEWSEIFNDDFGIFFFEHLKSNPKMFMEKLCQWLNIDPHFYDSYEFTIENKTRGFNNFFLHKLALGINQKFETVLRRNNNIKRIIRNLYYTLNSGRTVTYDETEALNLADKFYRPYNTKLKEIISTRNTFEELPGWLI